jgi:hypothetical protein
MRKRTIAVSGLIALSALLGCAGSLAAASPATAATATAATAASAAKAPPPATELYGVSCPAAKHCVAVGFNQNAELSGGGAVIDSWNGKGWSSVAPKAPKGALSSELLGVSCRSAAACVAVGLYLNHSGNAVPLAETWTGRSWTPGAPALVKGAVGGQLDGVSCASAKSCVAVGSYYTDSGGAALAESWNGKTWTASRPAEPTGSVTGELEKVSCPASAYCVAVGTAASNTSSEALADRWNGKSWTRLPVTPPASQKFDASLTGVSCPSVKSCVAVGYGTGTSGRPGGLTSFAEFWNDKTWAAGKISWPKGTSNDYLTGVSCPAAKSCLAVGQVNLTVNDGGHTGKAAATRWNGKTWSATTVPAPGKGRASLFTEVSCPSTADCVAVGQAGPFNSDEGTPLAGFWNTRLWKLVTP